ncbi:putative glucan endo-1,3-beta-glucosidase GVI [Papaver somniferum]|uniref:putative glucan endo-1,3-beta-glucosidase GVI n=1 Tax=Papaver somniferum TaxID=3469 RepID=UPI000E6F6371|nr:putative glucan endo-1,3-beta-glucosidase GVI [Papaver somniferum]
MEKALKNWGNRHGTYVLRKVQSTVATRTESDQPGHYIETEGIGVSAETAQLNRAFDWSDDEKVTATATASESVAVPSVTATAGDAQPTVATRTESDQPGHYIETEEIGVLAETAQLNPAFDWSDDEELTATATASITATAGDAVGIPDATATNGDGEIVQDMTATEEERVAVQERSAEAVSPGNSVAVEGDMAVAMNVLKTSYPPSAGIFRKDSIKVMRGVVNFLQTWGYPLFLNVYPYFAYANNPAEIRLDYALFNTTDVVVQDGHLQYNSLFYAMVDAVIWAVEKAGGPDVEIVVSETGWPSAGNGDLTTAEHARMYVNNLIATQMKSGTPKRPQHAMKTHIFSMYNENLKPEGVERNFGIYRPDLSEVYHVDWPKWSGRCNLENILHK